MEKRGGAHHTNGEGGRDRRVAGLKDVETALSLCRDALANPITVTAIATRNNVEEKVLTGEAALESQPLRMLVARGHPPVPLGTLIAKLVGALFAVRGPAQRPRWRGMRREAPRAAA